MAKAQIRGHITVAGTFGLPWGLQISIVTAPAPGFLSRPLGLKSGWDSRGVKNTSSASLELA
jgi:hypothetical protein